MTGDAGLTVSVAWSPRAGEAIEVTLLVPEGATVLDALRRSGLLDHEADMKPNRPSVGVWGRRCGLDRVLRDRDRVELYRPLTVDPMEARRRRQKQQSKQTATQRAKPAQA